MVSECKEIKVMMEIDKLFADELGGDEDSIERIIEYFVDKYCYTYKSGRRSLLMNLEYVLYKQYGYNREEKV